MEQASFRNGRSTVTFGGFERGASGDPYSAVHFALDLLSDGVRAITQVVMLEFTWPEMAGFFQDLADSVRGFEGERTWHSIEGHLTMSAHVDPVGHCALSFTVRNGHWSSWEVQLEGITVDAGEEMATVARAVLAWIESSTPAAW